MAQEKSFVELFWSRAHHLAITLPAGEEQVRQAYWGELDRAHSEYMSDAIRGASLTNDECGKLLTEPSGKKGGAYTIRRLKIFSGGIREISDFLFRWGAEHYQEYCRARSWRAAMNKVCELAGEGQSITLGESRLIREVMSRPELERLLLASSADGSLDTDASATLEHALHELMARCIMVNPSQMPTAVSSPKQFWIQWAPICFFTRRAIELTDGRKVD